MELKIQESKKLDLDKKDKQKKDLVKFDNYQYDSISVEIWNDNYRGENEKSREETWKRVAKTCASIEKPEIREKIENEFLNLVYNDRLVPGGRILANIGKNNHKGTTLFNCFVHNAADIKLADCDSIDGIYDMLKAQAKTLKSEGGYGVNASWIRPSGMYVRGIGSRTPGVLKFMELWDKSSEIITQGSKKILGERRADEKKKIRKGAQMLVLDVWHPDVEEFITAKQTPGRLTKFNVSVGIVPGFIEAVLADGDWDLKFPDTEHPKYKTDWYGDIELWEQTGYPVNVYKTVKARDLWDTIMTSTYNRAEPGVLFLDIANRLNPAHWFDRIKTTNPCGEIAMSTGVCNLSSLNLVSFIKINENNVAEFDFKEFSKSVQAAIRLLDNINDISLTPLPEYDKSVKEKRRVGLGVMGLGSLHFVLGIRYGSKESVELVKRIFKTKAENEIFASALLGEEKGSFEKFDKEKYFSSEWWKNLQIDLEIKKQVEQIGEMRNSHQSMNAPTGNTGIYARNVSGGIEPVFGEGYYRWSIVTPERTRDLESDGFKIPDTSKGEWFETEHVKFSNRGNEQILRGEWKGRNYEIDKNRGLIVETFIEDYGLRFAKNHYGEKFDEMKDKGVFVTAQELSVKDHINVLKWAAHYTNMSISKTINVPSDYPYEDFKEIYLEAWKNDIKGVTTYREGTMTAVLETKENNTKVNNQGKPKTLQENHAPKRPKILPCDIYHVQVKGEKWNFFVGLLDERPYEIFAGRAKHIHLPKSRKNGVIKKNGTYNLYVGDGDNELAIEDLASVFENAAESAFTRTVSLALRHGIPMQYVVEQLEKGADKDNEMFSLAKGLMRTLKRYIKDGTKSSAKKCPSCNESENLAYQEGCITCLNCSWSKCS